MQNPDQLAERVHAFVRRDFVPRFGALREAFPSNPLWARLRTLGTELWLDTGSLDESAALWTREFGALTTNNTLLNAEVQRGQYDRLVGEANDLLAEFKLTPHETILEIAFILNAVHALKLVHQYDARVSVEEHTALANDPVAAVWYGKRYHAICPERFIIKIPLTPAGLLATRRLSAAGIPVNHTLGFSARQNYVIARIGQPAYVNVFMGRLNSFVADNKLGSGAYVGERATQASQQAMVRLREQGLSQARQIGASLRSGEAIRDLAGLDVFTMPPKAAQQFLKLGLSPDQLHVGLGATFTPGLDPAAGATGIATLWDIAPRVVACVNALESENLEAMTPERLVESFARQGCADLIVKWTPSQVQASAAEGKIPKYATWREELASGRVGLDALMNLAGLNSFIADQRAMDERVARLLGIPLA